MTKLFHGVFEGKKVLVTGHTGFKGSWLSFWLTEMGANVMGYSLEPPTNPSLFETLGLKSMLSHTIGDVRDHEKLLATFNSFKPEIVFHLAAQPLVRLSYKEPRLTYETNVMGTVNLLEAVRQTDSVRIVVNITSDKCYDNKEWVYGYRENEAMGGYDPYSSSKGCAELVASAYRNSYFNPENYGRTHKVALASARAGNVIGGGDWALDRLVPDCVRSLEKNESIIIRNPIATRPWQHVMEPVSGYLWLAAKMHSDHQKYSDGWNFGPNDDDVLTVEEVVKSAIKAWSSGKYEVHADPNLHEAKFLKLDISKAKFYLKWKPVYSAEKAIVKSIEWYYEKYRGNKTSMLDFTRSQLKDYISAAKENKIAWAVE